MKILNKRQYRDDIVKCTLKESLDKEGKDWDVVIVEKGESLNKKDYSEDVLKDALGLFESAKCFAYEFGSRFYNHLPDAVRDSFKKSFTKNLVGFFTDVRYGEFKDGSGKMKEGVLGKLHILESAKWLRKMLRDAWEHGKKNLLGLSLDGGGVEHQLADGRIKVDKIGVIDEITVVTTPAAGGKFQRLVASYQGGTEMKDLFKRLVEMLKKTSPDIVEGLDPAKLTEDQEYSVLEASIEDFKEEVFKETFGEKAQEALSQMIDKIIAFVEGDKKADAIKLLKKIKGYGEKYGAGDETKEQKEAREKKEREKKEKETKEAEARVKESKASLDNIKKIEEETQERNCGVILKEKLLESKLPEPMKESIRKRFVDRIFKVEDIDKAIKEQDDIMGKLTESKMVLPGATIELGQEERDNHQLAMDGFFDGWDRAPSEGKPTVPRFKTFKEAYRVITGDPVCDASDMLAACFGYTKKSNGRLAEAITTTTFAQILGDSVTRRMIMDYKTPELNDWRKIVSEILPINDFRTQRFTLFGGYTNLPVVAQSGPYDPLTSPGDDENTAALAKRGGTESITLETLANDDVRLIKKIPPALGLSAAQTLYDAVFGTLTANVATTYDGVVLFHINHSNLGAVALSDAGLTAAKTAMMSQTAYGNTARTLGMANKPKYIMVPNELEDPAYKLTHSAVAVSALETATTPNIHSTYGLETIVIPNWTDTNNWMVGADPKKVPMFGVGFYQGKEEPELFVQDMPNVGSMFTNDQIIYKIRHIWLVVLLDFRGFYRNTVAGS